MADNTNAERQRRYRQRKKQLGMTQIAIIVPDDRLEEFHRLAQEARAKHYRDHVAVVADAVKLIGNDND